MNQQQQLTPQQRREIIVKAHRLVWCTKVDFNSPNIHAQLEEIDAAGLASHQLGPLTRQELEEAGVVSGNGFVHLWYVFLHPSLPSFLSLKMQLLFISCLFSFVRCSHDGSYQSNLQQPLHSQRHGSQP